MPPKSIVEEELTKASVFKDEGKLSLDYVPAVLLHRQEELRTLVGFFRSIIDAPGQTSPRAVIRGSIGTGKTALSKRFGEDFEKYARSKAINFRYIHVNCREEGSFFNILKNVMKRYEAAFPQRGYSSKELLDIFVDLLDKKRAYALVALDEVEALIRREGPDPLFSLTRLNENRPPNAAQRISLICIFREPECEGPFNSLDPSTRGTLGHNMLHMAKYTSHELRDIVNHRTEEAFKEDAVLAEAVELIADLAQDSGDARFAIELLLLSGKFADATHNDKVLPEHVRRAKMQTDPFLRIEDLRHFKLHEKLFLLALAHFLRNSQSAYAIFGEVEGEYNVLCETYGETPRAHTQLWKYVKNLNDAGMISTKISGKGQRGKTTFMGLSISSDRLEAELRNILEARKRVQR